MTARATGSSICGSSAGTRDSEPASRLILAQVWSPESGSTRPSRVDRAEATTSRCRRRARPCRAVGRPWASYAVTVNAWGRATGSGEPSWRRMTTSLEPSVVLDAEGVDALGPQPGLRPRGHVLVAGPVPAAEQVGQRRVAVGVRLEVLDHAGDERLVAEVGVELAQRGRALAVGDPVEVAQRLLGVLARRCRRSGGSTSAGRRPGPRPSCRRRTRARRRRTGSWSLVVR